MKKKKQSKKRWAWTKAQVRKQWRTHTRYGSPPKWYRDTFDHSNNMKIKKELYDIKNGVDPDDLSFAPRYHNNSAKWYWW